MKAFNAILKQTIRSAMRSKVFIVLFALILVCVIGLPLTIRGDNTAAGLIRVSLTYALNLVIALVSASCLWLGCSLLSSEIEGYQIHLVVTKPCPKWVFWVGKCVGIFLMHAFILLISMLVIYGLTFYRLNSAHKSGLFTDSDIQKLRQESLVARRQFRPKLSNLQERVVKEYEKRVSQGIVDARSDELAVKKEIMQDLMAEATRNITLKPGAQHTWEYENVVLPKEDPIIYLRFRMYSNATNNTDQRQIPLDLGFQVYADENGKEQPRSGGGIPFASYAEAQGTPFVMPGGSWQELSTISVNAPKNEEGLVVLTESQIPVYAGMIVNHDAKDSAKVVIANMSAVPDKSSIPEDDESKRAYDRMVRNATAVFQYADGPVLLCPVTSFLDNYFRTMLMAFFQLAFLAALGCTVGALFSTPVAVFAAIAYIVIGLVVPTAIDAPLRMEDGSYTYKNVWEQSAHYMAKVVQTLVVTVDDLNCTGDLANGQLVEYNKIGWSFLKVLVIRSGLLALVGILCLYRRELGLVVRRLS